MRILFFDIDCLRPDHLGCYGYNRPTSPNIDAVATDGVRFENYYCSTSPCLPSRMEWSSGRLGIRNGVVSNVKAGARFSIRVRNYGGPEPDNEMLMRRLRKVGWDPVSFSNFADRHSMPWFMCGWSEFHTPNLKSGNETAEEVHEPLMRWLEHNAGRDNYLLHVNYWDAHRCYKMDRSWADRFADYPVTQPWPDEQAIARHQDYPGSFTAQHQFHENTSPFALMPGSVSNRADFEHMVTGYDAAIAYVDHHVGIVLNEFARRGLLEDTAIIITADHGDAFGEHGVYSDHVCADECIHHIPLVVKWPGITKPGGAIRAMLTNVDLPPTLCEMLGAEIPADWDGASFAPWLRGEQGPDRDYLVWTCALYAVQRAVRTRRHLMIHTYDTRGYLFEETELYDMASDPYQTTNRAGQQPEIVAECDRLLTDWLDEQLSKPNSIDDPLLAVLAERRQAP